MDLGRFWMRLWKLLEPSQKQIKRLLVLTMFIEIISLIGPYILKVVIDRITNFSLEQVATILGLVVVMFLVNQSVSLFDYFRDRKLFDILVDVISYLASNAHKKMVF